MKSKVGISETDSTDVLANVPTVEVIRDKITQNRREAVILRQLLKVATRKHQLFGPAARDVAHA